MNLTKRIIQIDKNNLPVSDLILTVEYDQAENTVEYLKSISCYDYFSGRTIDITVHMTEHFEQQLDDMVDSIDWCELAAENEILELENLEN